MSFTTSHTSNTSPITDESAIAYSFEKPGQPILVLYLSANEGEGNEMSLLAIESKLKHGRSGKTWSWNLLVNPKTIIRDHSCSCGRNRSNCIHSTIESSGDLIARRVETDRNRGDLNLASLGVHQKPEHPTPVKKMKYIQIEFRTHAERIKFEDRFEETQKIYLTKNSHYWADMRREKQDHSVSQAPTK